ncbi:MAG: hypothetical protein JW915_04145, partial [Chitinispirillaceae bacterium]|nr:hypothetical protein [Chitinispirillaceae bacterium]
YEVGDTGALSDEHCSCGRGLSLLKSVNGRINDFVIFTNGVTIAGSAFSLIFKDLPVQQYQIIQQAPDKILIKIVKNTHYTQKNTDYILNAFQKAAGKDINICIEFCNVIQPLPSGKLKTVIRQYE